MTTTDSFELRYPIGRFKYNPDADDNALKEAMRDIAVLPGWIKEIANALNDTQLASTYRPGGWTIRQVIHHLADSHINAYIRFRLALTEENPVIKPYKEAAWAEMEDSKSADIDVSMMLLEGLHGRWSMLLENMKDEDFKKTFFHPERNQTIPLREAVFMYSWHGKHHLAHIERALEQK